MLYETYRTEKLSRTVHPEKYAIADCLHWKFLTDRLNSDSSLAPEELATQGVRLKEEQLRREEEKVMRFTTNKQFIFLMLRRLAS